MNRRDRIIGDSWYAESIKDLCVPLNAVLETRCPVWVRKLAGRPGLFRSFLLFAFGRKYDLIVTAQPLKGAWLLVVLESLFGGGRRRVVLLEFMPVGYRRSWWRDILHKMQMTCVKPALRRGMRVGHVLTMWEKNKYASMYKLPESRFEYIPWPQWREGDRVPNFDGRFGRTVVCSGRVGCDWTTFFKAVEGQNWQVTAICSRSDLGLVKALAGTSQATVLCNIPPEEHEAILQSAAVYVISVHERFVSIGQIRAMNAIRAGVPIVATNVAGLEGYLFDKETALLVNPGDFLAMRQAVARLLAQPEERCRLAMKAFELSKHRTFEAYKRDICSLVHRQLDSGAMVNGI